MFRRALLGARLAPFWTLVAIRVAFWAGAAVTLLWAPLARELVPTFPAYGPLSDLLFGTFAHWDSAWFILIAERGYESEQVSAFFPLYPTLVGWLSVVTGSTLVAGVLLSLVAAGAGAVGVAELGRALLGDRVARDSVLYLALYPTGFVFTAVYSDGLFLALSAWAFVFALRDRPWLAGLFGGLAVATRSVGLALLPALLILLWPRGLGWRELVRPLPLLLLPAALGLYALYLDREIGNATAFLDAQSQFWARHFAFLGPVGGLWDAINHGGHGAVELLRHLPRAGAYPEGGLPERDHLAAWNVIHLGLLVAAGWLTWVAWRRLGAAFGAYSLATILIVLSSPVDRFPLESFPRFVHADFPLFLALAAVTAERPRARQILLCTLAAVGAVAAVAFSRKVWIA